MNFLENSELSPICKAIKDVLERIRGLKEQFHLIGSN